MPWSSDDDHNHIIIINMLIIDDDEDPKDNGFYPLKEVDEANNLLCAAADL